MKKVLLFVSVFGFMYAISCCSNIFASNTLYQDNMFEGFKLTGCPDYDLAIFAKKNNLSKKEAKKILSEKFGEPKNSDNLLFEEIAKSGNPDIDLKNFALANNMSQDEAKLVLEKMFGEPKMPK